MKTRICFFLSLSFSISLFGQQSAIDSLEKALVTIREDTARINLLNQLAKQHNSMSDEKAMAYAQQAMDLSKKINYEKGIAGADFNIG